MAASVPSGRTMAADGGSSRLLTALPFLRGVIFGGLTHEAWSDPPAPPAHDLRHAKIKVECMGLIPQYSSYLSESALLPNWSHKNSPAVAISSVAPAFFV